MTAGRHHRRQYACGHAEQLAQIVAPGTRVEIRNLDTDTVVASDYAIADNELDIFGAADLPAGNYSASLKAASIVSDLAGGTRTFTDGVTVRFVVE